MQKDLDLEAPITQLAFKGAYYSPILNAFYNANIKTIQDVLNTKFDTLNSTPNIGNGTIQTIFIRLSKYKLFYTSELYTSFINRINTDIAFANSKPIVRLKRMLGMEKPEAATPEEELCSLLNLKLESMDIPKAILIAIKRYNSRKGANVNTLADLLDTRLKDIQKIAYIPPITLQDLTFQLKKVCPYAYARSAFAGKNEPVQQIINQLKALTNYQEPEPQQEITAEPNQTSLISKMLKLMEMLNNPETKEDTEKQIDEILGINS